MDNMQEIIDRLSIFKNLYDSIRIVNPIEKKILFKSKNNKILEETCYGFWKREGSCENCISMRAFNKNETFVKVELQGDKIFLVTASPVEINEKTYIVEMLKDLHESNLILNNQNENFNEILSVIKKISDMAVIDELTGVYNRRYITERLPVEINKNLISNNSLAVVMADIDHFKEVNDNYGHPVGDQILRDFSNIIVKSVRKDKDWVGRYGGEEFLIIINDVSKEFAYNIIEKIREKIEKHIFKYNELKINITSSFGICIINKGNIDFTKIIDIADSNLYKAKESGRNKTII